jgi:hypothetical protein
MSNTTTEPFDSGQVQVGPRIVVPPSVTLPDGSSYVHKDLVQSTNAWEIESHIKPFTADEKFGDVESWVSYVMRFSSADFPPFLTWNADGLFAVLDYPVALDAPTRRQVRASCPFTRSVEWRAWRDFADGHQVEQAAAVEKLDDMAPDIVDPDPAKLGGLLRSLRKSVGMVSESSIRPDGTATVNFSKDTTVRANVKAEGGPTVDLPSSFRIAIPVLKGHTEVKTAPDGKLTTEPVRYALDVKVRVADSQASHLVFRFSMPRAEQVLEAVFQDRIDQAKALLGPELPLLRAADRS